MLSETEELVLYNQLKLIYEKILSENCPDLVDCVCAVSVRAVNSAFDVLKRLGDDVDDASCGPPIRKEAESADRANRCPRCRGRWSC